jgi:hypothetical protein
VKYLLALSILVAALLLTPATTFGQSLYIWCDILYDEDNDVVATAALFSVDYNVNYYYSAVLGVSLFANNQLLDYGAADPYYVASAYAPAQPDTDYSAVAGGYVQAYFSFYYEPYWGFYDAFYFLNWGIGCNGFGFVPCFGYGPPTLIIGVAIYPFNGAWNNIHVPPPPPCPTPGGELSIITRHDGLYRGSDWYNVGVFGGQLLDYVNGHLITAPPGKYLGRTVSEDFDAWTDGCKSAYGGLFILQVPDKGTWPVSNNNIYGADYVGAPAYWVDYYLNQQASCSATITQKMSIADCGGANPTEYDRHQQEHVINGIPPGHTYNPKRGGEGYPEDWPWPY